MLKGIITFLFSFITVITFAQSDAEYLKQALVNTYSKSEIAKLTYDLAYRNGVSAVGAFLEEGNYITFSLYLYSGNDYVIIGGGDDDVKDLDIIIYDSKGNTIEKDEEEDANPIVVFSPSVSGVYTIKLKLYDCGASGSFCAMTFMQKNGVTPETDKFDQALSKMVKIVNYVDDKTGTKFLDREGEICFYGFTFDEDESSSQVNGIDLNPNENNIFVAMGDDNVRDIDLILSNSNGDKIDSDTEDDPTPIIQYEAPDNPSALSLKVENIDSPDNSVIFAVILED